MRDEGEQLAVSDSATLRAKSRYVFVAAAMAGALLAVTACAIASVRPAPVPANVSVAVEATLQARTSAMPAVPVVRQHIEDDFSSSASGWPDTPDGKTWYGPSGYRMRASEPGRFVALDAPTADAVHDGVISARFRKLGGPSGGGYGLIVADQGPDVHDGTYQGGQFIVAEAGDTGTFGIWQRQHDHWIDLVPWTPTEAVHVDAGTNELSLRAEGKHLTFSINGTDVGSVDTKLPPGRVGVFVGGDGNEVALEHFLVDWPSVSSTR